MLALAGCSGGLGRPSDLKVNETDWVLSWSPVENATASTTYIVEIDGREYVSSKPLIRSKDSKRAATKSE